MASYHAPRDWEERVQWLATPLHGRSSWRFPLVLLGAIFASGRRGGRFLDSGGRSQPRFSGLLLLPAKCRAGMEGTGNQVAGSPPADPQRSAAGAAGNRRFSPQTLRTESPGSRDSPRSHTRSQRQRVLLRTCVGHIGGGSPSSLPGNDRARGRMCRRSPGVSAGRFKPSWSKQPTW